MELCITLADLESAVLDIEVSALAVAIIDEAIDISKYKDNDNMNLLRSRVVESLNGAVECLRESFSEHHEACESMQLIGVKGGTDADVA